MGLFRKRQPEQRTLTYTVRPWVAAEGTATPASALANPDVWACVRALADAAASCPLIAYRRSDDGRRRASGRTAELLRAPAEGTTQAAFVATVMTHLLLYGNSYVGKYRDGNGRVEQLLTIPPDRVTVERRRGRIVFTVADEAGRISERSLKDVVHVKALSTDGLAGLSPIRQMRLALELNGAVREAATGLFVNGGRPSGILKMSGAGSQDQLEQLRAAWSAKHTGDRQGGIAVMSGDVEFTAVSMPADDAEFVAARKLSAAEVARCFRIPPWMIGAEGGDSMTYSNTESQALAFVVFSLQPWLRAIEQALTADRDLFGPSAFAEFLIDGLLRADSKTRAEVYTAALHPQTGWMRRDEVRRLENLEPETADDLAALVAGLQTTNGAIA